MSENYYDILGIKPGATDDEVKSAFRRQAMKFHPDRVTSGNQSEIDSATAKFQKINEAYAALDTASKRELYESRMKRNSHQDMADAFKRAAERSRKTANRNPFNFDDDWADIEALMKKDVVINKTLLASEIFEDKTFVAHYEMNGQEYSTSFEVKRGMSNTWRNKIVVTGGGEYNKFTKRYSDLHVNFNLVLDHGYSWLDENKGDITYVADVDMFSLILGGTFVAPTIDGKKLEITIRPNSASGLQIRVPNYGMFAKKYKTAVDWFYDENTRGTMYVILNAVIPADFNEVEMELLQGIKNIYDDRKKQ